MRLLLLHGAEVCIGRTTRAGPRPAPCPRQLVLHHAGEALQRPGARDQSAVDDEGRGAGHPEVGALLDVLLHGRRLCAAAQTLVEGRQVQPGFLGIGLQVFRAAPWCMGVEEMVLDPALALGIGTARRLVHSPGLRVEGVDRCVFVDALHRVAGARQELRDERAGGAETAGRLA